MSLMTKCSSKLLEFTTSMIFSKAKMTLSERPNILNSVLKVTTFLYGKINTYIQVFILGQNGTDLQCENKSALSLLSPWYHCISQGSPETQNQQDAHM